MSDPNFSVSGQVVGVVPRLARRLHLQYSRWVPTLFFFSSSSRFDTFQEIIASQRPPGPDVQASMLGNVHTHSTSDRLFLCTGCLPCTSRALPFTYRRYVSNQDELRLARERERKIRRLSESRRIKINCLRNVLSRHTVESDKILIFLVRFFCFFFFVT